MAQSPSPVVGSSRTILDSPFLNLDTVDKALSTSSPPDRINLLSAKLHLLTQASVPGQSINAKSRATSGSVNKGGNGVPRLQRDLQILETRLNLARAFIDVSGRMIEAEAELTTVLGECKRLLKLGKQGKHSLQSKGGNERASQLPGEVDPTEGGSAIAIEVDQQDPLDRMDQPGELASVSALRLECLRLLVQVEEALGREGRAKRWRTLIHDSTGDSQLPTEGLDKG